MKAFSGEKKQEEVILLQTFSVRKAKGISLSQREMRPDKNSDLNLRNFYDCLKLK